MHRYSLLGSLSQDGWRASTRLDENVQNAKLGHVLDYARAHLRATCKDQNQNATSIQSNVIHGEK
jgi:hypothetical protein